MRQLVKALHQNMSEDLAAADLVDTIRAEFQKEKHQVTVVSPLGEAQVVGQLTHGAITSEALRAENRGLQED
jgi:hypothetical protein